MYFHNNLSEERVNQGLGSGEFRFTGHRQSRIYCRPDCHAGQRMLRRNRVFFGSESEAVEQGSRPCGHCLRERFLAWRGATARPPSRR